jgi:hypothetical protein
MLPEGSMWDLGDTNSERGKALRRDRELERGWQALAGCTDILTPGLLGDRPLIESGTGKDGRCHHVLREEDGHSIEIRPDFKLVTLAAIHGPAC